MHWLLSSCGLASHIASSKEPGENLERRIREEGGKKATNGRKESGTEEEYKEWCQCYYSRISNIPHKFWHP